MVLVCIQKLFFFSIAQCFLDVRFEETCLWSNAPSFVALNSSAEMNLVCKHLNSFLRNSIKLQSMFCYFQIFLIRKPWCRKRNSKILIMLLGGRYSYSFHYYNRRWMTIMLDSVATAR
jgi:hypothetical protein